MEHIASKVRPTQKPSLTPVSWGLLTPLRLGADSAGPTVDRRMKVQDNSTHQTKHSTGPSITNSRNSQHHPITQSFNEPRLGHDFSRIRVNSDTHGAKAVNSVSAGPSNTSTLESNQPAGGGPGTGSGGGPGSSGPPVASPPAGSGGPRGGGSPAPLATVTIGNVTFLGSTDRIAPTRTTTVPVAVSGLATGRSVVMDVEGSGGANGTATITAGASLTGSGSVTVRGGTQTTPSNASNLKVRAKVGGTVVGRSPGFTVAAWPTNFTISRNADVFSATEVGLDVNIACVSDGSGALSELGEAEHSEQVDLASRDNPPWTIVGAVTGGPGTSGFMSASSSGLVDQHHKARAAIDLSTIGPGIYRVVYRQNFIFNDRRTGVTNRVVPQSGFTITHTIVVVTLGVVTVRAYQGVKTGAAVTAVGRAATAGTGTASSDVHAL